MKNKVKENDVGTHRNIAGVAFNKNQIIMDSDMTKKAKGKDVYNVQKNEKPGEVSLTSYLNFTDKEREIQYDPKNKIPLSIMDKRYQELIEKCKI